MDAHDLVSNLEFWSGRARNAATDADPDRPAPSFRPRSFGSRSFRRRSFRRPALRLPSLPSFSLPSSGAPRRPGGTDEPTRGRGRARPVAAAVLLAALTASWLVVGHRSHTSAAADTPAVPISAPPRTSDSTAAPSSNATTASPTTVALTKDCHGLTTSRPAARCVVGGVDLEVHRYTPATVAAAYRARGRSRSPASIRPTGLRIRKRRRTVVVDQQCARSGRRSLSLSRRSGACRDVVDAGRAGSSTRSPATVIWPALFAWWRAHPSE